MSTALYWYAISSVVLFIKMLFVSNYQAYYRLSRRVFVNPEDARVFGTGTAVAAELPQVARAASVWRNDVENIPIFLALGVAYVLVGASEHAAPWYFVGFTVSRIAHTASYLGGLQPWRTVAYIFGVLCLVGMSANIILRVM
jgi:glutathione S-transferase